MLVFVLILHKSSPVHTLQYAVYPRVSQSRLSISLLFQGKVCSVCRHRFASRTFSRPFWIYHNDDTKGERHNKRGATTRVRSGGPKTRYILTDEQMNEIRHVD